MLTGGQSAGSDPVAVIRAQQSASLAAASPLAQAEERISKRLLKNPIDMCYKGPAECQRSARGGQSAGSGGGEDQ